MKIYGGMILVVAALVALTGCSASPEPKTPVEASELPAASASPAPSATYSPQETDFLKMVNLNWTGDDLPSDTVLVDAANMACKKAEAGTSVVDIDVVDKGSEPAGFDLNSIVVSIALANVCPSATMR